MKISKIIKVVFIFLFLANLAVWFNYFLSKDQYLSVHFVDVGNGDGIFIKTPDNFKIIIDGGPQGKLSEYLGMSYPFSDKNIDLLVLSHPHEDHIMGAIDILKRYNVKKILGSGAVYSSSAYDEFLGLAKSKNIDFIIGEQGQVYKFGKVMLNLLYPIDSLNDKKVSNINNSSLVVSLVYENFRTLFLGDLEGDRGVDLLFAGADLRADVLKVSHQGSKNGAQNLPKFMEAVFPEIAVVSVGNNNFGHPSKETVDRINNFGTKLFRTDKDGTVVIKTDGYKFWRK